MPTIICIRPMENYRMEVEFSNGSIVILNLENKLHTIRFSALRDRKLFESATTDGISILWNKMLEISATEVFEIAKSEKKEICNEKALI